MYFFYVLQSLSTNNLYKGISNNIDRRLAEHNKNKNPGTRGKGPWKVLYFELHKDLKSARNREKFFKSGMGRELLKQFININNPL
ncbi:GIY-YIG nuclease family protein [Candidatus Shapirobacteria bacterium]|nr:MAG: GIY-YIG nuclease family protein [Candidatus Shapirobacteria bacterium]